MPLTTIASFRDAHAAHIARARLEAEGIPAFVADEHLVGVHWLWSDAIGGVKLRVPSAYAEEARAVVAADHSAELRGLRDPRRRRAPAAACGACGSSAVTRSARAREAGGGPTPLVLWTNHCRCESCGASW